MNRRFFFIWMLAAGLCSGCNHSSDDPILPPTPPGPEPEPDPTPIELYTALLGRSLVDKFEETPIGIAVGKHSDEVAEIWDAAAGSERITLTPIQYYPADGTILYIRGFYPRAQVAGGKGSYILTGQEDLLFADAQAGSLSAPFSAEESPLTFRHLLAQLNINLQAGDNFPEGYALKSFQLKGSSTTATLDVLTGELHFDGNIATFPLFTNEEGKLLVPGNTITSGSILVEPGATLTVDFVLTNTEEAGKEIAFNDLPVEFEGGESETGLSYKLNIQLPDNPDPEEPDNPDPDNPDPDPDNPDNPDPDNPDNPDPDNPDNPDPDKPDPEEPETPDLPGTIHLYAVLIPWVEGDGGSGGILR